VQFNGGNGTITIGANSYPGGNGMNIVAIGRQPVRGQLDAPQVIWNRNYKDPTAVNNDLTNLRTTNPDAMILVNASGAYGFNVWQVGSKLVEFGATTGVTSAPMIPFVFLGISGTAAGTTPLERGYSTRPVNGYLATDSNGNYAFIQTDFVRYDIATNGDISVGGTKYPVSTSFRVPGCDGTNSFHFVIVDREDPTTLYGHNTYCTGSSDSEIGRLIGDLRTLTSNFTDEGRLVFMATNGSPIPSNWNFGTDGDARFYPLAQQMRALGGFWETIVYLKPGDTYSMVGAVAPPTGTKNAYKRAREMSSVYPEISAGKRPSGELHGVLARSGRGNWYSPLNADPSGYGNLGFYQALATPTDTFPVPSTPAEQTAYQGIVTILCGASCNIRDLYDDLNVAFGTYVSQLRSMKDTSGKDCDVSGSGADPTFCKVRGQLLTEFQYVADIQALYANVNSLWLGSGTLTLASQMSAFTTIQSQIQPPPTASSQSLMSPLVNLFLGLGSLIPEIGPAFGLADVAFNFGTSLTTDNQGNKTIDLTSTVAGLLTQSIDQFTAQGATTGTLFKLVLQDYGKLAMLGSALANQKDVNSPWYWDTSTTSTLLRQMTPAIQQASYQAIMAAAYAIGGFYPNSGYSNGWGWGLLPLSGQPYAYVVGVNRSCPCVPISHPFWVPNYIPYTYPSDPGNEWADDPRTASLLTDGQWLGISQKDTPWNGTTDDFQYTPPSEAVRTQLFNPVWKSGLGVYRPAFFNNWPFPRVQCTQSWGDFNGYSYSGGCNWSAAAAAPEHLASPPATRTSATIRAHQMLPTAGTARTPDVQIHLAVHNNGTVDIRTLDLTSITVRTVGPGGSTTLTGPTLPVRISNLKPGKTTSVYLRLNVPIGVTRISISEQGSMTSGVERAQSTSRFSEAQAVIIR
jgi:hypothetical protein